MTGGRVTLSGPVTLRLLPTPYLEVGAGSAAMAGADAPRLAFEGARLELALVKLASGAFRFTDVRLEKPVLTLTRSADGALVLPSSVPTPADAVGVDRFSVRDGTIRIAAKGGAPRVDDRQASNSTATRRRSPGPTTSRAGVAGPGGAPVVFRLASEKAGPGGAPVRIAVEAGRPGRRSNSTGGSARRQRAGARSARRSLTGTSPGVEGPMPWRAAGKLAADLDGASLTGAEFRFGPEERALRAEGSATLAFRGAARLAIDAKARQANVDATVASQGRGRGPALTGRRGAFRRARRRAGRAPAPRGSMRMSRSRPPFSAATRSPALAAALRGATGRRADRPIRTRPARPEPPQGRGRSRAGRRGASSPARSTFRPRIPALLGRWAGQGAPELAAWTEALDEAVPASSSLAVSGPGRGGGGRRFGQGLCASRSGARLLTGALAVTRPVGDRPRPDLRRSRRRFARPRRAAEPRGRAVARRRL